MLIELLMIKYQLSIVDFWPNSLNSEAFLGSLLVENRANQAFRLLFCNLYCPYNFWLQSLFLALASTALFAFLLYCMALSYFGFISSVYIDFAAAFGLLIDNIN